ncbi:MAG: 1-(5-phosphoribosyl)-5-[(5-phosphoribosylamino)methylideneamino]imidazole-4-carboxamide isomerase [Saprospiraceae bacterium]|nr:1-(5-phosphoribosyl)-5-[(5-phosphoribosylamino)methylideneamino]imidazole-4-carboxamide isomerase [Saprospiraceae bacterium]
MEVIPAIDIIGGKCVRLEQGAYDRQKIYYDDPLEVAIMFESHGIRRLHLVDLDGAKAKQVVNWSCLQRITSSTSLKVDFGGGIKTESDLQKALELGADQVTVGSTASDHPKKFHAWLTKYGADRLILGADLKNGKVATHGWLRDTDQSWQSFIELHQSHGVQFVICTDIQQDGMLAGPSFDLYKQMKHLHPSLKIIASGGVATMEDLHRLRDMELFGAIVGKAIYEQRISLPDLETFCNVS